MKSRIPLVACASAVVLVAVLISWSSRTHGGSSEGLTSYSKTSQPAWEYAQLEFIGHWNEKSPEFVWGWASSEDGVIGQRGDDYDQAVQKFCTRFKTFEGASRRTLADSPGVLLDCIGAMGWELVHYFEKSKRMPTDSDSPSRGSYECITELWHFKRLKLPSGRP